MPDGGGATRPRASWGEPPRHASLTRPRGLWQPDTRVRAGPRAGAVGTTPASTSRSQGTDGSRAPGPSPTRRPRDSGVDGSTHGSLWTAAWSRAADAKAASCRAQAPSLDSSLGREGRAWATTPSCAHVPRDPCFFWPGGTRPTHGAGVLLSRSPVHNLGSPPDPRPHKGTLTTGLSCLGHIPNRKTTLSPAPPPHRLTISLTLSLRHTPSTHSTDTLGDTLRRSQEHARAHPPPCR